MFKSFSQRKGQKPLSIRSKAKRSTLNCSADLDGGDAKRLQPLVSAGLDAQQNYEGRLVDHLTAVIWINPCMGCAESS
jgi:hypothetical protein